MRILLPLFLAGLIPVTQVPAAKTVILDEETRRIRFVDDAEAPWFDRGFARVRLSGGVDIRTDDPRFVVTRAEGDGGGIMFSFSDRNKILALTWEISALDDRSATVQLLLHNRSAKTLKLDRLDVLFGRLADQDEVHSTRTRPAGTTDW